MFGHGSVYKILEKKEDQVSKSPAALLVEKLRLLSSGLLRNKDHGGYMAKPYAGYVVLALSDAFEC